jgi:hypothetical protein
MHDMHVDSVAGAEGVEEASETSHTQPEVSPEWSEGPPTAGHLVPRFDLIPAQSFSKGSLSIDPDDPEGEKFFNKELNRKLREYLILGTVAGLFTGVANGIQKEIMGTEDPGAYVFTSLPLPCHHSNGVP